MNTRKCLPGCPRRTGESGCCLCDQLDGGVVPQLPRVDVAVFAMRADMTILLGKRSSDGTWSTPGGDLNPGEVPDEAARRTFREDTGLDFPRERFTRQNRWTYASLPDGRSWLTLYYNVFITTETPKNVVPEKYAGWEWFKFLARDLGSTRIATNLLPSPLSAPLEARLVSDVENWR